MNIPILLVIILILVMIFLLFNIHKEEAEKKLKRLSPIRVGDIFYDNQWGERVIKITNINASNPRKVRYRIYSTFYQTQLSEKEYECSIMFIHTNYISKDEYIKQVLITITDSLK